jgi:hypothetical protein
MFWAFWTYGNRQCIKISADVSKFMIKSYIKFTGLKKLSVSQNHTKYSSSQYKISISQHKLQDLLKQAQWLLIPCVNNNIHRCGGSLNITKGSVLCSYMKDEWMSIEYVWQIAPPVVIPRDLLSTDNVIRLNIWLMTMCLSN